MKKVITYILVGIGAAVAILWTAGSLGIGHFMIYYGPSQITCTRSVK